MKKIYFDYAASTPIDPRVLAAMRPYFSEKFGNPGSLHRYGQEAIAAVDCARETIAQEIGAEFREVVFTASATEANNLALRGAVRGFRLEMLGVRGDRKKSRLSPNTYHPTPRVIVSSIEHESVLETARDLEREGVEVVYLPVDRKGRVRLRDLERALNNRTVLVSVMYANNEIGTIEPISEIARTIRDFKKQMASSKTQIARDHSPFSPGNLPLFHTDAAQAFQFASCGVNELGVDLMTLSAHKIYGPKGIGILCARSLSPNTYHLKPVITGGGQEFGLRSGTENVPSIVGFAEAVKLASRLRGSEGKRIQSLKERFIQGMRAIGRGFEINGAEDPGQSLPHIVNIFAPRQAAADLVMKLDLTGIAISSGSACRSRSHEPSYVIEAISGSKSRAERSFRVSFGRSTKRAHVDKLLGLAKKFIS